MKQLPDCMRVTLFMPAVTGQPAEYATLPKVFVAPLVNDLATSVASR